jgi:hypothetical protein
MRAHQCNLISIAGLGCIAELGALLVKAGRAIGPAGCNPLSLPAIAFVLAVFGRSCVADESCKETARAFLPQ